MARHRRLRSVGDTQLGKHPADVRLDGLLPDAEALRDLLVGEPLHHQPQHVALPHGHVVV